MFTPFRLFAAIAAVLLLIPAGASAQSRDMVKKADTVISHLEAIGGIAIDSKGDCEKMGVKMLAYMDKNGDALRTLVAELDSLPQEEQRILEAKYKDRAEKAVEGLMGSAECMSDPKVAKAFEAMEPAAEKKDEPAQKEVKLDRAKTEAAEALLVHIETIGTLVEANKGNCGGMAKGLNSYIDKAGTDIDALLKGMKDLSEDENRALEEAFGKRLETAFQKYMGVTECADNEEVQKALERMQLM